MCVLSPFTASQAAARARGRTGQQSAAASSITGMSLQEAQQILNISTLSPEEIQKVQSQSLSGLEILFTGPPPICLALTLLISVYIAVCGLCSPALDSYCNMFLCLHERGLVFFNHYLPSKLCQLTCRGKTITSIFASVLGSVLRTESSRMNC